MNSGMVTIAVSISAMNWFILESLWTRAKIRNGYRVYSAPRGLKALYFVAVPTSAYGAIVNYLNNPNEKWVSALLLVFAVFCIYEFPASILISRERVVSIRWFGIIRTQMEWQEVDCIYLIPENDSVVIQDKEQKRIIHTM